MRPFPLPSLLFVFAVPATAQSLALKGLDPVALCGGSEVANKVELVERRGGFSYQFANAQNQQRFRAEPDRFEIQWGGACARMGPLSGLGDASRFLVHEGRIYIFASEACRTNFEQRTERFLDRDTPTPEPTAATAAAGAALRERALAAHGGRDRLRAWRSYRHRREVTNNGMTEQFRLLALLPDRLRLDHDYVQGQQTWRHGRAIDGQQGFFVNEGETRAMPAAGLREMRRDALHEPLFALRASCDGTFVAVGRGKNSVGGIAVDEFELWQAGSTTTFGVDAEGRVRTARYRGRGPEMWFGDVTLVFDDFTIVGGLLLPQSVRGMFDGKDAPELSEQRQQIEIDSDLPEATFAMPK